MARSRQLNFQLTADLNSFSRGLRSAERDLVSLEGTARRAGGGMGTAFRAIGTGAAAATAAIGAGLVVEAKRATEAFEESAKVAKQTEAVLKSTGGQANVTAGDVERLATALSRKAGVDDEAIQSGENLLLTFTRVRNEAGKGNDVFNQATRITLDMSVALGRDLSGSALMVGKALQDPIRGITALRRAGVNFTKDQQAQIKVMVESGRTLDAQRLILRELNTEFGGSAEAQARPLDRMRVAVGNLEEGIGRGLSPVVSEAADQLTRFAERAEPILDRVGADIERVFGRRDLTITEKFRISAESARRDLQPLRDEASRMWEEARVGDRLGDAINAAAPKIVHALASHAPDAAKAFAEAWMGSDVLTRAVLGAWLLRKAGGFGAFRRLGASQGAAAAEGYQAAFAAGTAVTARGGAARAGGGGLNVGRGVMTGLGARALGVATGPVGLAAITAATILGPELVRPFTRNNTPVSEGVEAEVKKAQDAARRGSASMARYVERLDELAAGYRRTARSTRNSVDRDLAHGVADALDRAEPATRGFMTAIKRMERSSSGDLKDIRTNARIMTNGIRKNFGQDTETSRDLLARNFNAAANAVKRQMDRAGHETREGVALMNHYLRAALAEYGITGKQATRYLNNQDTLTGKTLPGSGSRAGAARGGRIGGRDGGGWIGMPGERGQDAVPIVVGRGEAVLNRHQQAVIEGILGDGFLDKLFSRVTTPHYMAKGGRTVGRFARGGIVSVPGFPGERAASSVIPMIEWIARTFGLTLTDAYGQGHKSPGHTRFGTAADFAGSNSAMDRAVRALVARGYLVGYDGRFGSQRWPGHGPSYVAGSNAHLHVELGGRGGAPAAAPRLGRVVFAPGMGVLSTLGQRGMDALRSGAQATLERAAGSIVDVGGGPAGRGKFSKARLAALWTQAGGPPAAANLMAAIALAESGGSPSAHNPSGATGLWQILGNPFPGNAYDPLTNARMAVSKYRSQGLGAWAVYTSGAYRRYLARGGFVARAARGRRPAPRAVSGAPQRGSSESLSAANWRTSPLLTRLETAYQMNLRTPTIYDEAVTLNQIRGIWRRRYRDAVRSRDPARIQSALEGLNDVESRLGQVSEGFQQSEADAGQRVVDFLTAGAEQQRAALDAPLAGIEMRAALAGLTPDTTDDVGAATQRRDYFAGRLRGAQAAGNVPDITEFATSLKAATDALDSLTGAADTAANDGFKALADAMSAAVAEQKRTNDLTVRYGQIADPALLLSQLAQVMSQAQGGRLAATSAIPGAGRLAAL